MTLDLWLTEEQTAEPKRTVEVKASRRLDQFYTRPEIAKYCVMALLERLDEAEMDNRIWVEPSAGSGAFLSLLPEPRIGLDLEPHHPEILTQDFLRWAPKRNGGERYIVAGNPPFGRQSTLAIQFFNTAACFADVIAFILPRSFEKVSVHRKLDRAFVLLHQVVLPDDSFLVEGEITNVPSVFQIWKRTTQRRGHAAPVTSHADFAFVSAAEADFAFQRVGVRAGLVSSDPLSKAETAHYFIKVLNPERDVQAVMEAIDWSEEKARNAGNPSIAKTELIQRYQEYLS